MAKKDTIDQRVNNIMKEAFFMPLFFVIGINALKEKMETMSDKELAQYFGYKHCRLSLRKQIIRIHAQLNEKDIRLS